MRTALAITKREMKTYFNSPIAYIVIGVFLLVAGYLYFSTLFLMGRASLRGFFGVAPVLFVVFGPAVTMRLIAEEKKSGTLELLLTMPVRTWELVLGKFLAALGMVCVGLAFTFPYAIAVSSITAAGAHFDWGPVVGGYVGLVLLASAFLSMGLVASAISRNQIVGFILGLLLCFAFYFVDKFAILLPESLAQVLEYVSVDYHFENVARGVLDTKDLVFYFSLTAVALLLTVRVLSENELPAVKRNTTVVTWAVAGSLILLNIISLRAFARVDLTRDGMYTLSKSSKETVAGLAEDVTVTAYFTESLPAPYSSNARYVRDLLEEYRAASKGRFNFEFIDPSAAESAEDKEKKKDVKRDIFGRSFREPTAMEKELAQSGIQAVEIRVVEEDQQQTKRAFMGMVIKAGEQKETIPVVQDTRTLEYDITSLVKKMVRTKKPVVAVLSGHQEPSLQEKLQKFGSLLSQMYTVKPLELQGKAAVDEDVDVVFVLGPQVDLQPNELKALDQFLMKGKSVAYFVDALKVDTRTFEGTPVTTNLAAMLATYGVTLGDQLVADVQSAQLNVQERRGFMVVNMPVPYPFVPMLQRLEGDSPLTAGLTGITFPFTTALTTGTVDGVTFNVLAKSSHKSWLENKPYNTDPRRDWRSETITTTGPYNLMVEASGKFKSHFAAEAAMSTGASILAESTGTARIIVAGGSAVAQDDFMNRSNQALMLNVADWLLLDPALLAMRARGLTEAPLQDELSDGTRAAVKYGNILGMPALLALYGLVRWRMREGSRALALAA
jgi:gliding-associated putative ABC transporter substrate-binding component GldG